MKFVDFNPRPIMGQNTNGVNMVYELLNDKDQSWLTQSTSSVSSWACEGGNGYFNALKAYLSDDDKKFISDREQVLYKIGCAVSEFVKKEYDLFFNKNVEKTKTVTIDVPKVRKVGLFRKEEYIDHETKTERYYEQEAITYKGWRLEKLYRQEGNGSSAETLILDYCLGADGKIYLIVSEKNNPNFNEIVLNTICYSPAFLNSSFCNVYSSAISGVIGTLDAIPIEETDPLRKVHIQLDDDYYYNFPIQIDDGHSFTYGFLDGAINRIVNLLDENGKKSCCEKYNWMKQFIYPNENDTPKSDNEASSSREKFNNAAYEFDFERFVAFGSEKISVQPYAKDINEFQTNPNGCFVSAFLTNRLVAADDLARAFPKFNDLIKMIADNQTDLTAEKLESERQFATNISKEYSENGNVPENIFVLLTAYSAFLSQGTKNEQARIINQMMVDRACEFKIVKDSWEEFLISVILWFSDKDGYKDKVVKRYLESIEHQDLQTNAAPDFKEMIDVDLYAQIGAKLYGQYDGEVDIRFVSALIQYKLPVAEIIVKSYPSFTPVYEYLRDNNESPDMSGAFDKMFDASDLFLEVPCAVLMASLGAFLDRNNPDRSTSNSCIICVERALNKPGTDVVGIPLITLLCVALWFSDYKGYKEKVYEQIKKLAAENWYSEGKHIDIEEVRRSIDKSKF